MELSVWVMTRITAVAALWLLAASVAVGYGTGAAAVRRPAWVRPLESLHRGLAVAGWTLALVHALLLRYDPSVPFSWRDILVPMAASYRPLWTGLGTLALYGWGLILLAFDGRERWGVRPYRVLHGLAPVVLALVALHAAGTGTDAGMLPLRATGAALGGMAVGVAAERLVTAALRGRREQGHAHPGR